MDIASKYNPKETEEKWYSYWMQHEMFSSVPDEREPYTIVIPPPNVTGVLHMGHMLNNTIQDILVRRARMLGKNACWVPGTDHASIATEARVVAKLKAEGIEKNSLTRDEFLTHAWEWKEKHGGIILEQLKKLGASCDWSRVKFTMDDAMSESVIDVFIDLYKKGHIYRGVRMVNWDPQAKTAVSDEEVVYKEVSSKLYHVRYKIDGENEWITIATTRPETILGDTAVCVHPEDERFLRFHGKKVVIPLVNRIVPLITDEYVDREFGTGALKITPAHDINDYEIGIKYDLEVIDIFNDDGTLNKKAQLFIGEDRFAVRNRIADALQEEGNLVKTEDYTNKVGYSERTDAVIEPKLSMQWFVAMKEIAGPALDNVLNDLIKLHPKKFKNTYRHWMENVKDWCISRQLWWGQQIPAYYIGESNQYVIAKNIAEALSLAREKTGNSSLSEADLRQDPDVLDTWFSSWLWPISVFDGIRNPDNKDINYYYPTNELVTAPEILFFWVARMIIAGYEYRNEKPFENVYLTGIVRDKQRRKMSKSLGNSPDPLELISKYSADGVRVGMLLCSPAGGDLLFDENLTEQGRNFGNKIWNAYRLISSWKVAEVEQPLHAKEAIEWFREKLNQTLIFIDKSFMEYRLSEALMTIYKLFWDDFSSWYLEAVKPEYQKPVDRRTIKETRLFFDALIRILHPIMPFITEELWHLLDERKPGQSIMVEQIPVAEKYDNQVIASFDQACEVITQVRNIRKQKNIPNREPLRLYIKMDSEISFEAVIKKLANLTEVVETSDKPADAASFLVGANEYYVPLGNLIDVDDEISKIEEEEKYLEGFLKMVMKKLGNEKFVNNAPKQVVEAEQKKKADAEQKLQLLKERLKSLKKQ